MNTAKFVIEVTVTDPDSNLPVELSVFKHDNGGMFAIDSSWLDQCTNDYEDPLMADPFEDPLMADPFEDYGHYIELLGT